MVFSKTSGHCNEMRHPGQLKSLQSLLNARGGGLDTLQLEAQLHQARAKTVLALLPEAYWTQVRLGDLEQGLLTLYVPSAALATKLRFEEQRLLASLTKDRLFQGIRRIQLRVRPTPPTLETPARSAQRMADPVAAAHLSAVASQLQDGPLKARFQQLAARVSGNPPPDQSLPMHSEMDPQTVSGAGDYSTHDHCAHRDNDQ